MQENFCLECVSIEFAKPNLSLICYQKALLLEFETGFAVQIFCVRVL